MEKNSFILQRLKKWEKEKAEWYNKYEELRTSANNDEERELLETLKSIVENSVEKYKESEKINLDSVEYPKEGSKEKKKLDNDIMFELQDNYPKNLDKLDIKNSKNILNLSINPGSTQKEGQEQNSNKCKVDDITIPLYSFDKKYLNKKEIKKIITDYHINEKYIWNKYYKPNFEIFSDIGAKYPWVALEENKLKEDFDEILRAPLKCKECIKNKENEGCEEYKKYKILNINNKEEQEKQIKKDLNELMSMYNKEKEEYNENVPLVFFNDLFWIADSNQKALLSILKYADKNKIKEFVEKLLDIYIEKYKLKLIVVTNVKASEYIIKAICNKEQEKEVRSTCIFEYNYKNEKTIPIIFSGYLANGMDNFSVTRLKNDIKKEYDK